MYGSDIGMYCISRCHLIVYGVWLHIYIHICIVERILLLFAIAIKCASLTFKLARIKSNNSNN